MWFWFSVLALLFWSGSDLLGKIGCRNQDDRYSHLKMITAVGIIMGAHAAYSIFVGGASVSSYVILTYLPVSLLYIVSMAFSYAAFRYIELSISSPICNSSGAIVAILVIITSGLKSASALSIIAIALVCLGTAFLGYVEAAEDEDLRAARQEFSNYKYSKSPLAIVLPIAYCLLDALGTFADSIVLERLDEESANCAYELTFFIVGLICLIYLLAKKEKFVAKQELPKYIGGIFETVGQVFYIYALSDSEHVAYAAPIIASFCIMSVVWSRIFLKEKLSLKHYGAILLVVCGIVILGILDL